MIAPSLRDLVQLHRPEILERCRLKLRTRLPALRDDELLLQTRFLDEVAAALGGDGADGPAGEAEHQARGRQRQDQHVPPHHLVRDYGDVCESIFETAEEHGAHVEARDAHTVNSLVDRAAAIAIDSYWRVITVAPTDGAEFAQHLGAFAHDLRNSASSARFAFHMLREGKAPVQGKTADVLGRSLDRIQTLSGQVLDLSRASAHLTPERLDVELAAVLRDVEAAAFPDRGVRLRLELTGQPVVSADARLLRSAVENLVQNALKFTADGGLVTVRARTAGGRALVEIEDACGGLPADAAAMFEPFVQRGSDRSGAGLGLTIAKRTVEAHGGVLSVRDLPGQGCVFTVDLPLAGTLQATL